MPIGGDVISNATRSAAPAPEPHRPGRPPRRLRSAPCLAAAIALALAVPLAAASVSVNEVAARPASGAFTVTGRGFGHGRGMSQWGAYGAADAGLSWPRILAFYYPGTVRSTLADSQIRVWLSADTDGDTQIVPAAGLTATSGSTSRRLPAGPGYAAWRAVASGGRVALQFRGATGGWRAYAFPAGSLIRFATTSGLVRVRMPGGGAKEVRGTVSAVADSGATGRLRTVLNSTMESYLRSVVPNEMPSSWHPQAIAAQSVAARTYAASYRQRQRARNATWDICDTVTCQVFKGVASYTSSGTRVAGEDARSSAAITATANTVLRTSAAATAPFVHAEFSASNGGYTVAGPPAYQVAKPDPYDGRMKNPSSSWKVAVTPAAIEKAFSSVGRLRTITITQRDGNGPMRGRVRAMRITGSKGSLSATGATFRARLGLRSDWFSLGGAVTSAGSAAAGGAAGALVYADRAGVLWRRPAAGPGFGSPVRMGTGWRAMDTLLAPGQWDRAGGEDLVARQRATGRLLLYRGDGRGGLRGPGAITGDVRYLTSLASAGDLDSDGYRDLVALDSRTRNIVTVRGAASGRVAGVRKLVSAANVAWVRGAGDLNGDGTAGIVWADTSGRAYLGTGDGAGRIARVRALGRGWNAFAEVLPGGNASAGGAGGLLALRRDGVLVRYAGDGTGGLTAPVKILSGLNAALLAR